MVVNEEILNLLKNQDKENCFLWTSADKNRADFILKELDLYKYFNKIIFDHKKDLNTSLKRLKDITKSNVFLIFEDNDSLSKYKKGVSIKGLFVNDFSVNKYKISYNNLDIEKREKTIDVKLKLKSIEKD